MSKKTKKNVCKKRKKKTQSKKRLKNREFLEMCKAELKGNIPKSEQWFIKCLDSENERIKFRLVNNEIIGGRYIADFLHVKSKTVIEIDGTWHDQESAKIHDKIRDKYLRKKGYTVIRIKAYDKKSLHDGLKSAYENISIHTVLKFEKRERKKANKILKAKHGEGVKLKTFRCFICNKCAYRDIFYSNKFYSACKSHYDEYS